MGEEGREGKELETIWCLMYDGELERGGVRSITCGERRGQKYYGDVCEFP